MIDLKLFSGACTPKRRSSAQTRKNMDDIVKAGYVARKQGNEEAELGCFYRWCESKKISSEDTLAAVQWEMLLSQLKWNNHLKTEWSNLGYCG